MAEIVVLNKWLEQRDRRQRVRIGASTQPGELVMFTGVRYERFEDWLDRKAENHAVVAAE